VDLKAFVLQIGLLHNGYTPTLDMHAEGFPLKNHIPPINLSIGYYQHSINSRLHGVFFR